MRPFTNVEIKNNNNNNNSGFRLVRSQNNQTKNCDFKESDFNVSDNREGKLSNSSGLNKEGTVALGELIKLAGKLIDAWVNNNKKKIYCRDCGYYGDI